MPHQPWTWTSQHTIPSETGAGQPVIEQLLAELERRAWSDHDRFSIHLALEEAIVNAMKHGNKFDAAKSVNIECRLSEELLSIEIIDEGEGFDPEDVPDPTEDDRLEIPSGRGLMLMRNFMSRVEFNEQGNKVHMVKELTSAEEE